MYQKDFIIFLIEQFARIVKKILAKILKGDFDDASLYIEQVYRQHLGVNSDLLDSFTFRYLMDLQKISPDAYPDRCLVLAELLRLEGRIFQEQELPERSFKRYIKALNIFLTIFQEFPDRLDEDHRKRTNEILEALDVLDYETPSTTRELLKTCGFE